MPRMVKSNRGQNKLIDDMNYVYEKQKTNADGTKAYWKCEIKTCRARVHTVADGGPSIVKTVGDHGHSASAAKSRARETLMDIKARALSSQETTRSLIADACGTLDANVMAVMPSPMLVSRNIRNWRQVKGNAPPIPQGLTGYSIPDEYKVIGNGELFLQFDSGEFDKERMLMFATEKGLDDLMNVRQWAGDGTFKCSPNIYYQLYTLHVQNGAFSVPRLFVLLANKSEVTYTRLFNALLNLRPGLNPTDFMMDFEKAHMNSISSVFPSASISTCLFHFGQNIYRKVCEFGFKQKYHTDDEFSIKIRCLCALAFLPVDDVTEGFEELTEDEDIPQEIVSYFEATYIGCLRGRGMNQRRTVPLFPIPIWNVHNRTEAGMPRTNNNAEAYHNSLQSSLSCVNPNLWKLISALKKENNLAQLKKIQYDLGTRGSTRKVYRDINHRLQQLLANYKNDAKIIFLQSIASNLHRY